jgi:hypothetical protein
MRPSIIFDISFSDVTNFDYQFTLPRRTLVETIRASGQMKGQYENDSTVCLPALRCVSLASNGA